MEKLVYRTRETSLAAREALCSDRLLPTRAMHVTSFVPTPHVEGSDGRLIISAWFACLDRRGPFETRLLELGLRADGYLVTESCVRHSAPGAHREEAVVVLLRQASRLGQAELRTRTVQLLMPAFARAAAEVTCDSVVRPLSVNAEPLRQLWRLRCPVLDADRDWSVQLASIALPEEYEIERGMVLQAVP